MALWGRDRPPRAQQPSPAESPTGELPEHLLEHVVGGTSLEALMVRLAALGLLPDKKDQ
ncbi:MAG: hypothetical protein HY660_13925 [Armatimonadetes bacterium]|nr:hypothetical protein [Armatimonadota bacterium]